MDVDTITNQPLTGEEIVQVGNTGEDIVQVVDAGEDIVQVEDAADDGEQTGQVEDATDAGEQTGQVEDAVDAGEQTGQVEGAVDAGEQTGQGKDAQNAGEASVRQAGGDADNNNLPYVNLTTASGGVCRVYLIGVTHRTEKSCNEVRSAIRNIKPQVVFLELCDPRLRHILEEPMPDTTWKDVVRCTITGQFFITIVMWFLSKMVADIDANESEFKVAHEEAKRLKSVVIAGDMSIGLTYERIWKATSLKQKSIIVRNYKKVYAGDEKEMKNLYDACPSLYKILVEDRDKYMTLSLRELSNEWSSILAVVGKDHVKGIHTNLSENIEINEGELAEEIIRSTKLSTVNNIVVSVGIVGILVACYFWKKN